MVNVGRLPEASEPEAQRDTREDQIDDAERQYEAEAMGSRHEGLVSWVWTDRARTPVVSDGITGPSAAGTQESRGIGSARARINRQARSTTSSGS